MSPLMTAVEMILALSALQLLIGPILGIIFAIVLYVAKRLNPKDPWILQRRVKKRLRWPDHYLPSNKRNKSAFTKFVGNIYPPVSIFVIFGLTAFFTVGFYTLLGIPTRDVFSPDSLEFYVLLLIQVTAWVVLPHGAVYFAYSAMENRLKPHIKLAADASLLISSATKIKRPASIQIQRTIIKRTNRFRKSAIRCGVTDSDVRLERITQAISDKNRHSTDWIDFISEIQLLVMLVYDGRYLKEKPKSGIVGQILDDRIRTTIIALLALLAAAIGFIAALIRLLSIDLP